MTTLTSDEVAELIYRLRGEASWRLGGSAGKLMTEAADALQSLIADKESGEATHRHVKRGTEYVLIGFGKMQADNWVVLNPSPKWEAGTEFTLHGYHGTAADMQEVAIYRSLADGSLWARPREGDCPELDRSSTNALPLAYWLEGNTWPRQRRFSAYSSVPEIWGRLLSLYSRPIGRS